MFIFFFYIFVARFLDVHLQHQLREYDQYYFHDLMVDDDILLILLSKERYSPKISISDAMMSEMSTKNSYSNLSYALISFDIFEFDSELEKNMKLIKKKNIITKNNSNGINPHVREKIVDSNRLFFNYDVINSTPCTSIISLYEYVSSEHITCRRDIIRPQLSFDRKSVFYNIDNKFLCIT